MFDVKQQRKRAPVTEEYAHVNKNFLEMAYDTAQWTMDDKQFIIENGDGAYTPDWIRHFYYKDKTSAYIPSSGAGSESYSDYNSERALNISGSGLEYFYLARANYGLPYALSDIASVPSMEEEDKGRTERIQRKQEGSHRFSVPCYFVLMVLSVLALSTAISILVTMLGGRRPALIIKMEASPTERTNETTPLIEITTINMPTRQIGSSQQWSTTKTSSGIATTNLTTSTTALDTATHDDSTYIMKSSDNTSEKHSTEVKITKTKGPTIAPGKLTKKVETSTTAGMTEEATTMVGRPATTTTEEFTTKSEYTIAEESTTVAEEPTSTTATIAEELTTVVEEPTSTTATATATTAEKSTTTTEETSISIEKLSTTTTTPEKASTTTEQTTIEPLTTTEETESTTTVLTTTPESREAIDLLTTQAYAKEQTEIKCIGDFVGDWVSIALKKVAIGGAMNEIMWKANGEITLNNVDSSRITPLTSEMSENISLSWNIDPVQCGDIGMYICTLDTGRRYLAKGSYLSVKGKPDNPILWIPSEIRAGDSVLIRAEWQAGYPISWGEIRWFMKKKPDAPFKEFTAPAKTDIAKLECEIVHTSWYTLVMSEDYANYTIMAKPIPSDKLPFDEQQIVNSLEFAQRMLNVLPA